MRHAEELQNKDLQKALIRDHAPLIINLAEDEDSDDEDSDDEDSDEDSFFFNNYII